LQNLGFCELFYLNSFNQGAYMNNTFTKISAGAATLLAPLAVNTATANAASLRINEPSPTIPRQEIIQARNEPRRSLAEIFQPSPTVPTKSSSSSDQITRSRSTPVLLAQQSVAQKEPKPTQEEQRDTIFTKPAINEFGEAIQRSQQRMDNIDFNGGANTDPVMRRIEEQQLKTK